MKLRTPAEHEQYNSCHYPGTRQLYILCEGETYRCEDDTIYIEINQESIGPLCIECYRLKEPDSDDHHVE